MRKISEMFQSGAFGALPAVAADNPDALRAFGIVGNVAANKMKSRDEEKKPQGMKKGGMVSASKRADGCAKKGKTKGRMV